MNELDVGPTTSTEGSPVAAGLPRSPLEASVERMQLGIAVARRTLASDGQVPSWFLDELDAECGRMIDAMPPDAPPTRAKSPSRGPLPYRRPEATR